MTQKAVTVSPESGGQTCLSVSPPCLSTWPDAVFPEAEPPSLGRYSHVRKIVVRSL